MDQVVVTGISIRSCLGDAQNTWRNILAKNSGITIAQPFPSLPAVPLGLIETNQPQSTTHLTKQLITDLWSDSSIVTANSDLGIVIGSSRGCQSQWEQFLTTGRTMTPGGNFPIPWNRY